MVSPGIISHRNNAYALVYTFRPLLLSHLQLPPAALDIARRALRGRSLLPVQIIRTGSAALLLLPGHHNLGELVDVDAALSLRVELLNHRLELLLLHALADLAHRAAQVVERDYALALDVEQLEGAVALLHRVAVVHERARDPLPDGQRELAPHGRALALRVPLDRLDAILDQVRVRLRLGQLEPQRPQAEPELVVVEAAVLVYVEYGELQEVGNGR